MEKGEEAGDFFNRLKNQFDEAEMEKATIWTLFVCKFIKEQGEFILGTLEVYSEKK